MMKTVKVNPESATQAAGQEATTSTGDSPTPPSIWETWWFLIVPCGTACFVLVIVLPIVLTARCSIEACAVELGTTCGWKAPLSLSDCEDFVNFRAPCICRECGDCRSETDQTRYICMTNTTDALRLCRAQISGTG